MNRRRFLLLAGALTAPLAAGAQTVGKVYRIGLLDIGAAGSTETDSWLPFLEAMREMNYAEGRNLVVSRASAAGRAEDLTVLAGNLVQANVEVIVTTATRETRAARQVTSTIPIVMSFVADPVGQGLVASLSRPGGNVTGLTNFVPGLRQKYVELLKETVPTASRFAVIASRGVLGPGTLGDVEAAAKELGLTLLRLPVEGPDELDAALTRARKEGTAGVIVPADAVLEQHRKALVTLILKHRLPAIYWRREYVEAGGLMTYGTNVIVLRRRAPQYVDKILRRQSGRPPHRATHEVRAHHQPQDRQGPGAHDPAVAAGAGRSNNRMMRRRAFRPLALTLIAPYGAKAQPATVLASGFSGLVRRSRSIGKPSGRAFATLPMSRGGTSLSNTDQRRTSSSVWMAWRARSSRRGLTSS
jgi:putative ABC transport system substrate-binding protein